MTEPTSTDLSQLAHVHTVGDLADYGPAHQQWRRDHVMVLMASARDALDAGLRGDAPLEVAVVEANRLLFRATAEVCSKSLGQ